MHINQNAKPDNSPTSNHSKEHMKSILLGSSQLALKIALVGAVLWLILSGGQLSSWLVGVPAVFVATWVALRLRNELSASALRAVTTELQWSKLPNFAAFFIFESFRGGIDVARRMLHRQPDINPGFIDYDLNLNNPTARLFFANCVSLMPGSLTVLVENKTVRVHVLDIQSDPHRELRRLEDKVSELLCPTHEALA